MKGQQNNFSFEIKQNRRVKVYFHMRLNELNIEACGLYYKSFMIVIYDHNDSTIIEPIL
jgi:hypothetical protein